MTRPSDVGGGWDPAHVVALLVLASVLGAGFVVVATGELAGRIAGNGSPGLRLSDATGVLARLPSTLDDPRGAWPMPGRQRLPEAPVMYLSALLLLCALSLPAVVTGRLVLRRRSRDAFASRSDIADLIIRAPEPGRITLGRCHGRTVAALPEHSVLVLGATRSGKTRGFAIPNVRDWQGPAIVLSAKTDLLHATINDRRSRGPVWVYDPTCASGLASDNWSPLQHCTTWADAVRTANTLSRVSGTTSGLGGAGKHWERVAAQLTAPLLLAASASGLSMADVVRWIMTKELKEPAEVLTLLGPEADVALTSLRAYVELEPRARDSAFSTARTALDVYEDPSVLATCADWTIRPELLLDGGQATLYVVGGTAEQTRLAPLFLALLEELLRQAYAAAARRRTESGSALVAADGSLSPRLLLLLDEAANIAPLPQLATLASTGGGEGIQLVTIFQDLAQVRHRYGTEWGSVVSNHVAKVALSGVTDPETLRYFSSTIGEHETTSSSVTVGADGRRSRSVSTVQRPVATPGAIRRLRPGSGMLLYGHRPPAFVELTPGLRSMALVKGGR